MIIPSHDGDSATFNLLRGVCVSGFVLFSVVDLSEIPDDKQLTVDDVLTAGAVDGLDNKEEGMSHSMENFLHTDTT